MFLLAGIDIVRKSLRIPCYQIANNSGVDASEVVNKVIQEKPEVGYDAMNNKFVNMIETGIIDPTKVGPLYMFEKKKEFVVKKVKCVTLP